jgi:hypothetical protein
MTRGISRLKYHLAKIPRHDVGIFLKPTPEIMRDAHDSIEEKDKKKQDVVAKKTKLTVRSSWVSTIEGSGRRSMNSATERSTSVFSPQTSVGAQPSIMSMLKKREKEKADKVCWEVSFLEWHTS